MKRLEVKHKDGWYYNPDELRKLTEKVNGQEYGDGMGMEEVEAVLLAIDESPSPSSPERNFLGVLEENYEAAKRMVDEDKVRPAQEIVLETYEDLISIYKAKYNGKT